MNQELKNFLDDDGKVKVWPKKIAKKHAVLEYIAQKFESGREYSEKEVNVIINEWHLFGDYFILRRGMVDYNLLKRTRDGSKYWKEGEDIRLPEDARDGRCRIIIDDKNKG